MSQECAPQMSGAKVDDGATEALCGSSGLICADLELFSGPCRSSVHVTMSERFKTRKRHLVKAKGHAPLELCGGSRPENNAAMMVVLFGKTLKVQKSC